MKLAAFMQTDEQQNVSQDEVEEKYIVGVGLPEFQSEDEKVDHSEVQRKSQNKPQNHHTGVEFVERNVVCCAVVWGKDNRCCCHSEN